MRNVGLVDNNVTGGTNVGGLVGYLAGGTVNNSYATGNVTGSTTNIGGLVGYIGKGTVDHSYTTGKVKGGGRYVGGLVGYIENGTVNNSYATGSANGSDFQVGGLVGYNDVGTVNNSYSTAVVNGSRGRVGGLVGESWGMISYSYATGNVSGGNKLGGLVGFSHGDVINSYATGVITRVLGTGQHQGGFIGSMSGDTVLNCYSTGKVMYAGAIDPTSRGFAGHLLMNPGGYMKGCFWDNQTSLQTSTVGNATGKNTTEMKTRRTFEDTGWNFSGIWWSHEKVTYPLLRWQDGGYPLANAGPDQIVRNGTLVTFDGRGSSDSVGLVNYTWTFTDGNPVSLYGVQPTHRFNNYGKFLITLNVTNKVGRWATDTMFVTVRDYIPPVADAGPDQSVDEGTTVTFDGSGSSDNVKVVSWTWTFTDGLLRTLTGVKPTYRFDPPKVVIVTLKVTDKDGNSDTDTMNVTVNDIMKPVAVAGPDQVIGEGTLVTFDGSGSEDNIGIVNYTWTFNDGTGDIELYGVASSHTFNLLGVYTVTLNVVDAAGLRDADTLNVSVQDVTTPISVAGDDQTVDEGEPVTFDGSGSTDNVGIINYTWTFNDGSDDITLYGVAPSHTFSVPGVYTVTLNVTDAVGLWDSASMTVTVRDITSPVAHAGPDQTVDEDTIVTFDGTASVDNVGIVNYTWTFNDGSGDIILYGAAPSHTFSHPGAYPVTLNVTDAVGLWSIGVMTVTVRDITSPVARAGPDQTVDEDTMMTFDGTASVDNVGITEYTWTFNDGSGEITLDGATPSHTFSDPGVYVVTLAVSDPVGLWGSDTITVTVRDITPPVAHAGPDQTVDEDSMITFDGKASVDNVGITKYTWTFNAGTDVVTLYGEAPLYILGVIGIYTVTLTVVDAVGLTDSDVMTMTVRDITSPVADAGPDQTVDVHTLVTFDGTASVDNVGITNHEWTFNDGTGDITLSGAAPTHTFSVPGVFTVTLKVTDAAGNWDEAVLLVTVVDSVSPTITYEAAVSEAISGLPLTLTIEASDNVGVTGAFAIIRYGSGDAENLSMRPTASYSIEFDVPRNPEGDLTFYFAVRDEAGNWFTTEVYTITLMNAAPEWDDIPEWSITEEHDATLDLAPYLSDDNDDVAGLVIECDDDTVTVEGLLLKARYDEAVEDWTMRLTVSDGEDEADVDMVVHIVNMNDAPVVVSISPENGTKYGEGKKVTFTVSATDEDGDDLDITWVSDGKTLGTGATLDYKKLKPGTRVVKVSVTDGTETIEEEFTLVIKKEEESSGFGMLFTCLSLVAAVMLSRRRIVRP